jgi:GNAT superfamily N-acetyltransferase
VKRPDLGIAPVTNLLARHDGEEAPGRQAARRDRRIRIRGGRADDFAEADALAARALLPAYNRPGLSAAERAENEGVARKARQECLRAVRDDTHAAFVAMAGDLLAGFIIVDCADPEMAEIDWMMVAPEFHGTGVASALMTAALRWIGPTPPVALRVVHFNARAIAFYRKFGFVDCGTVRSGCRIPRRRMQRPAGVALEGRDRPGEEEPPAQRVDA